MKIAHALALAAVAATPALAQEAAEPVTPASVVASAPASDWRAIDPADLLVMILAPDREGRPRQVVVQLMPTPFSQGWVGNIRTLARAHWWDGTSVYRVVDNWVAQWGDVDETKPLPEGILTVHEAEYVHMRDMPRNKALDRLFWPPSDFQRWTAFHDGFPYAGVGGPDSVSNWPAHCYGSVGVARDIESTGTGTELYAVIGHAPRQLDRNIAVVGRVIEGIEHLATLPRGKGEAGVYDDAALRVPIVSARLGSEVEYLPQPHFEYLASESESFARYVQVRANRNDPFYKVAAGGIDVCNVQVPIRRVMAE